MKVPEILFTKILYTTDLTEGGRAAFAYAASLSRRYGAKLTVFHVVDENPDLAKELVGYMDEALWEEIKARDLQEARQLLIDRKRDNVHIINNIGEYCETIQGITPNKSFIKYDVEVQVGNPVEKILAFADENDYDLIILGHVGHSVFHDTVIGSTVRRVLRKANKPVLVIKTDRISSVAPNP